MHQPRPSKPSAEATEQGSRVTDSAAAKLNIADLRLSGRSTASRKCTRCHWSGELDQLFTPEKNRWVTAERWRPGKVYVCFCCSMISGFLESQGALGRMDVEVMREERRISLREVGETAKRMLIFVSSLGDVGHPADLPIPLDCSRLSGDTASAEALSWVQEQIATCSASHERCKSHDNYFLPTRLIGVRAFSGSQDVQLIESKTLIRPSKYVALSHCWGKFLIQCLTKKGNLSKQLTRISWERLTQTFQDAVDFTRRLGIDYIWIDSMCIVQDDSIDWLREASMMFSVYNNAHVTLAGVHGHDGSVGLYSEEAVKQIVFSKPIAFQGQELQLHAREPTAPFHDWRQLPPDAPLFTRVWCFQELIISSRVVFFTKQELLWECFGHASCECTPEAVESINNLKILHFAALADERYDGLRAEIIDNTQVTSFNVGSIPSAQARGLGKAQKQREYRVHQWHSVVEQYSELELTKDTDRLPAIGGIAEHYHKGGIRVGERYLAGLWSGSLLEDLLWWAMVDGRRRLGAGVAPSWSWASVTDAVQYYQLKEALAEVLSVECH
jgi:hypothetical protein